MKNPPAFPTGLIAKKIEMAGGRYEGAHVTEFAAAHEGASLRAYIAAHADVSCFDIHEHVLDMRADRATYIADATTTEEAVDAIADLKVRIADAVLRRLARGAE